jgi:hypothetical protein
MGERAYVCVRACVGSNGRGQCSESVVWIVGEQILRGRGGAGYGRRGLYAAVRVVTRAGLAAADGDRNAGLSNIKFSQIAM